MAMSRYVFFFFFTARLHDVFARDGGAVHPTPCLTRADVAFYDGSNLLDCLNWWQADRVDVRFRGHKRGPSRGRQQSG